MCAPAAGGEPTPQEVRKSGVPTPRVTSCQMKTQAEMFLKGKSPRRLPPSHRFSLLNLSLFRSLPLHPSPPSLSAFFSPPAPGTPCLLPEPCSDAAVVSSPETRVPRPARPPPLPGPLGSVSHPEEQVEAEKQVLDAPQAPAEAPHAAAPAAGSRVPRPATKRRERREPAGRGRSARGPGRGLRGGAGPAGGGAGAGRAPREGPEDPQRPGWRGWGAVGVQIPRPEGARPRSPPERGAASFPPNAGRRAPQASGSGWLSEHLQGRSVHWGPETHLISSCAEIHLRPAVMDEDKDTALVAMET